MEISYTKVGDYLLPNLTIEKQNNEKINKYGYLRLRYLKENNSKVGISVKPNTAIEEVYEFLPYIHMCLVMTVEPGKGGQSLLPDTLTKIATLKRYVEEQNLELDIQADGGINLKTAPDVKNAGANVLVAGTAIVMAKDFKVIIDELKE